MRRLALVALLAGLIIGPASAQSQAQPEPLPDLFCNTWGYDVVVFNRTEVPVPAGTTISWSVWGGKRKGEHVLKEDLRPHIGYYMISALEGSYWDLRPCEVHVVR